MSKVKDPDCNCDIAYGGECVHCGGDRLMMESTRTAVPDTKPCQWCGKPTPNSNACDPCWEIQRQVENAPTALLIAMVRKLSPVAAATFMGEGFRIARDNVTADACVYDEGQASHVELNWTDAENELAAASGPSSPLAVYPFR